MVWDGKNDQLTDFDLGIVGRACVRITIPANVPEELRVVADLLRGYASQLDHYARRTDMPKRIKIHAVKAETTALNAKIRAHFKVLGINVRDGRPTDKERLGQNGHAVETERTEKFRVSQHLGMQKPQ